MRLLIPSLLVISSVVCLTSGQASAYYGGIFKPKMKKVSAARNTFESARTSSSSPVEPQMTFLSNQYNKPQGASSDDVLSSSDVSKILSNARLPLITAASNRKATNYPLKPSSSENYENRASLDDGFGDSGEESNFEGGEDSDQYEAAGSSSGYSGSGSSGSPSQQLQKRSGYGGTKGGSSYGGAKQAGGSRPSYGGGSSGGYGGGESYEQPKFSYGTDDGYGTQQERTESQDAQGNVKGSYQFMDDKGIMRRVDYTAGPEGFKAVVSSNEPGLGPENPADVQMNVRDPPAGLQPEGGSGGGYGGGSGASRGGSYGGSSSSGSSGGYGGSSSSSSGGYGGGSSRGSSGGSYGGSSARKPSSPKYNGGGSRGRGSSGGRKGGNQGGYSQPQQQQQQDTDAYSSSNMVSRVIRHNTAARSSSYFKRS